MSMRARVALAFLLLLTVSAGAQNQAPYVESFEVRIHNVDVVVTDKQGATVRGLTRDDFEIAENGKPQPISNFAAYDESASVASAGGTTAGPAPLVSQRQRRTFVLYIDEMALHPLSRQRIITSASEMIRQSMQPGDEAMIVAPAAAEKLVLAPTGDRDAVLAKLAEVVGDTHFRAKTQTGSENFFLESQLAHAGTDMERRQLQQVYAGMVRKRVEQRLGQVRSAIAALRNVEGKKILVLLTASLAATPGLDSAQSQAEAEGGSAAPSVESMMSFASGNHVPQEGLDWFDLRPLLADIGRTAAANGVTIYGMQPEVPLDLAVGGGGASQRGSARGSTAASSSGRSFQGELASTQVTFETLASETGGGWFRGGRLGDGFRQISSDLRSYYSLAYRATGDAGKGRRVEVRIKGRPDLRVRTRTEVVERTLEDEMDDLTVASLYYPRRINELGIHVEVGTVRHSGRTATVPVIVKVPLTNLTLLPEKDLYRGSFRLHFAAAGENADFTANQDREQIIEVPTAGLAASRKRYFTYETELRFDSGPGRYRIAVGVIDPISHLSSFSTLGVSLK